MRRIRKRDKNTVMIESDKMEDYIEYINTNNMVTNVQLNSWYYKETDLRFLRFCPSITEVNNVDCEITDFTALYEADHIMAIYSDSPKSELDLSYMQNLKELYIGWNKNVLNLNSCKQLEKVSLSGYRPKLKGVTELAILKNLRELTLVQSSIEHLEGISNLESLESLNLYYLRNFKKLDEVSTASSSLKGIDIQNCPNIHSYEGLGALEFLEDLRIDSSREIPNLGFVKKMKNLNHICLWNTDVGDGDLSYLEAVRDVTFTEKKYYSHKMKDFLEYEVK